MRIKYLLGKIPAEALNVLGSTKGEHIRIFNYQTLYELLKQTGFECIKNKCWF